MSAGVDIAGLGAAVATHGTVVRVLVAATSGSAPREPGTAMLVWHGGQSGTIGGGALEFEATRSARALLDTPSPWARAQSRLALGPALGQCCGGAVHLVLERFGPAEVAALSACADGIFARPLADGAPPLHTNHAPGAGPATPGPTTPCTATPCTATAQEASAAHVARTAYLPPALRRAMRALARDTAAPGPGCLVSCGCVVEPLARGGPVLMLYGAGHVGRALVHVLSGLDYRVIWVDAAAARFPDPVPPPAERLVARNPADAVTTAPDQARHIVMTHSHALDLEICHRVLSRRFAGLGLIGSASKAARFRSRLAALGHDRATLDRLACPIGDKRLGRSPEAVAIGIAAELLRGDAPGPAGPRRATARADREGAA